jgi:hypothetical protein
VNELRRTLLDDSEISADLPEELRFLASRQASAAALLIDHAELYRRVLARVAEVGPTDELKEVALDAAGNLATVLQSIRSREDLLHVLVAAPDTASFPATVFDQLFYSFTLLAAPGDDEHLAAALDREALDVLMDTDAVKTWLAGLHAEEVFDGPLSTRFGLADAGYED